MKFDPSHLTTQLFISVILIASVWIAYDHPKILTPWVLLACGHCSMLLYFAATGQWGFWPMNLALITIGLIRVRHVLKAKSNAR